MLRAALYASTLIYPEASRRAPFPQSSRCRCYSNFLDPSALVSSVLSAISCCPSISDCRAIHGRVIKSLDYRHGYIGDCLVSAYGRSGSDAEACKLFDELPEKDLVSWNSWISGISRKGYVGECFNALHRMRLETELKPNDVTFLSIVSACTSTESLGEGKLMHGIAVKFGLLFETKVVNSLINMYGKLGFLALSRKLFEEMQVQNLVSWNSIIAVHSLNGYTEMGVSLFTLMRKAGFQPDQATIVTLLHGCAGSLGTGKLGEAVHCYACRCGLNADISISTAILSFYAKSGRLNNACNVFQEMSYPDAVAWTAMLAAYAVHGNGREAIRVFELMVHMHGLKPDHVTFTHLLSACSHSGLVKEGKLYFNKMAEVYGVEPRLDHYSCMVDLFCRSGHLKDARDLIGRMPMEPNPSVWGALLGGCRVYRNIELGTEAAERLIALDPSDSRNYIMLSNIYSAAGLWKDASMLKALMKEKGLSRNPGCSFIEHGGRLHRFVVGDRLHPDSERIHNKLNEVLEKIREAGFNSKTEFVLHDVDEEVKEEMISKHSEKLAIAFGLLETCPGVPIIITKNLRICGDCHGTAKLISSIEKRKIIIRDSKRFHHFVDGVCSCGDHW